MNKSAFLSLSILFTLAGSSAFATDYYVSGPTGSRYSLTDVEAEKGKVFYRLQSVDKDDAITYSKIVTISCNATGNTQWKLFPNPVTTYYAVSYPVASASATLHIFAADGKRMGDYNIATGSAQRSNDVSDVPKGAYFIVYTNNGQTFSGSFIK